MAPRVVGVVALIVVAVTAASVAFVKHQDEDNQFCVACHLHEKLLQERLDEAEAAAASGDSSALAAALAAYQAEVDAATADAGNDQDWLAHLQAMLAKHTATLTELAATLPAESSIERAIDASSKAITRIETKTHPAQPTHKPQGGGDPQSGGQGNGGGPGENGAE